MRSIRTGVVLALGGAGLACGNFAAPPEPEPVEPTELPARAPSPTPEAEAPEVAEDEEICCILIDHYETIPAKECDDRKGEPTPRIDLCGFPLATEDLLQTTSETGLCGYSHRQDGRLVLIEIVSIPEALVTVDGSQRHVPLNPSPSFPGPAEGYVYELEGVVRIDVLRDEQAETAKLEVYRDGQMEERSTRTTFLECGD